MLCAFVAAALAVVPEDMGLAVIAAVAVFILAFVSVEVGIYILIFSMLLSPEIIIGGMSGERTTAGRGVTLRTEDFLLVLLAFAWLVRMAVNKELGLVRYTPLNRPIGYYTLACIFATGMGMILGYVKGITGFFFVLKYIEYFVVFFMVVNNVHSRSQIQRFTIAMLLTALVVSLVGVAQIPSGERVSAPFEGEQGEPNTFGGYLLLMSAVAIGLAFQGTNRKTNYLLGGLVAILVLPFLATLSRASYLGAPFVYLTFLVLHPKRRPTMLIALLVIIGAGTVAIPDSVKDRVMYTFEQAEHRGQMRVGGVKLDTSTSARLKSWNESLSDFTESPIWGFGITGYKFIDAQYPRVLVETGLLGLSTFFILVHVLFKETLRIFRESDDPLYKGLAMGLLAALAGLLVHALGSNTFTIVRIMEPFWLIVGLVIGAGELEKRKVDEVPAEPAESAPALARLV